MYELQYIHEFRAEIAELFKIGERNSSSAIAAAKWVQDKCVKYFEVAIREGIIFQPMVKFGKKYKSSRNALILQLVVPIELK